MLVIVANFIMVVSNSRFRFSSAIRFCSSNLAFCSSVKDAYHVSYKYSRYHEIASHWLMQYQCLRFNSANHAIMIVFLSFDVILCLVYHRFFCLRFILVCIFLPFSHGKIITSSMILPFAFWYGMDVGKSCHAFRAVFAVW